MEVRDRTDAEYFQPEFLEVATILKERGMPLKSLAKLITSAFYPSATQLYSSGTIPFIRCLDVIDYPVLSNLQQNQFEKLPKKFIQKNPTIKTLHSGDIVITKVGTPCYASIINESLNEVAISRTVLGMINIKIDPYYLVAFLRSRYGFFQLMRERELTIQLQLTLERVGRINVFIPKSKKLIDGISSKVKKYFNFYKEAILLYREAENLFLQELGLKDFKPKYELSYSASLSDVFEYHRVDAEYFQPAYEELMQKINKNVELKPLRKFIVSLQKGIEVGSENYEEEGKLFIRVSNLSINGFVEKDQKYIDDELYKQLKDAYKPEIGDFLLTKDATPGIAYVVKEPIEGVIASGILKLKINEDEIDKEYLALCINSLFGKMQIERDGGGSVITHWKPEQIKKLAIPILHQKTQQKIAALIQKSHEARKKAKELLELSKRAVEIAIEKNEKEALEYLYKKLGDGDCYGKKILL